MMDFDTMVSFRTGNMRDVLSVAQGMAAFYRNTI